MIFEATEVTAHTKRLGTREAGVPSTLYIATSPTFDELKLILTTQILRVSSSGY